MTDRPASPPPAPPTLNHVIGQHQTVEKLKVAVEAACARGVPLPSMLLTGAAGTGKSMLARLLATEMASDYIEVLGQTLSTIPALNGLLVQATAKAVVFIDEIHELTPACQVALLKVLDEGVIHICDGQSNRVTRLKVSPFTIIGATTNPEALLRPLTDRFKVVCPLQRYSQQDLIAILKQKTRQLDWPAEEGVLVEIAQRSFGTPRLAIRLMESVHRTATARGVGSLNHSALMQTLEIEGLDSLGLDADQQRYLSILAKAQGPVRLSVMASKLRLDPLTVSRSIEDKLLDCDLIERSQTGRILTAKGWEHVRQQEPA